MSIVSTAIRRPVTISMITVGLLAFGVIGLKKLPINLLPDLSYPTLTLETKYAGAAPEEVEYLVTRQIEEAVAVIPRIKRTYSSSKPELSQVTVEFEWGRDMDFAILDVSKKIDLLRLPDGVEKPRILRYDPNQDPILKVSVTSDEMPLTELRFFCEEELKKRLDGVPGLAAVKVNGGKEEIIEIRVDEEALKRYGLGIDTVTRRLVEENVNRAGGSLYENEARYLVRTLNEFVDINDIRGTIITREDDRKVVLGDVAEVTYGFKDRDLISRINAKEGVELSFYKEGDANTVQVSRDLKVAVADLEKKFENKIALATTFEGAAFIQNSIDEVISNAAIGGLIAVIILLLFLRDIKSTLIVSITIPVSVFLTFFLMLLTDVSLNIMSLGGLALGVGMLVDNSIVVLESIFVRRGFGDSDLEAADQGTSLVAGAVSSSTLTTIVVFLPIVFIKGIAGQLFRDLGLTVTYALIGSLVVSLTLIPTLYVLFSKFGMKTQGIRMATDETEEKPKGLYAGILGWCLRHRFMVVAASIMLIGAGYVTMNRLGVNLIPEMTQGEYFALIELDEGTPIESSDSVAEWVEQKIAGFDEIDVVFTTVGEFNQGTDERKGENLVQVNFSLKDNVDQPGEVVDRVRAVLNERPEIQYQIGTPSYFNFHTPIEVEIYSDNQSTLKDASGRLVSEMLASGLFKDIRTTVADGNPEVQIKFKRETMSKLGLSIGDVSQLLRDKIQGTLPTRLTRSGRDIDIQVRLEKGDRSSLKELDGLTVGNRDGRPIFLSSVAEIRTDIGPSQIRRVQKERCAVISADLTGSDLDAAVAALNPMIDDLSTTLGIALPKITGQAGEKDDSFGSMLFVIGLAIFLVYLVMASQFESLLYPFLILFIVPLGLVGGLVGLYVTGLEISVIALIGMIMLAGIVVNNAIVLIDYINHLRSKGMVLYDALLLAGQRRLRPIMMTTTTTVLGLVPMALGLGEGAEMRTPLAITVIGGLTLSTALTLILIPVLYGLVTKGFEVPSETAETVPDGVLT